MKKWFLLLVSVGVLFASPVLAASKTGELRVSKTDGRGIKCGMMEDTKGDLTASVEKSNPKPLDVNAGKALSANL